MALPARAGDRPVSRDLERQKLRRRARRSSQSSAVRDRARATSPTWSANPKPCCVIAAITSGLLMSSSTRRHKPSLSARRSMISSNRPLSNRLATSCLAPSLASAFLIAACVHSLSSAALGSRSISGLSSTRCIVRRSSPLPACTAAAAAPLTGRIANAATSAAGRIANAAASAAGRSVADAARPPRRTAEPRGPSLELLVWRSVIARRGAIFAPRAGLALRTRSRLPSPPIRSAGPASTITHFGRCPTPQAGDDPPG